MSDSIQPTTAGTFRHKNGRVPISPEFADLVKLCRTDQVFKVDEWFKRHKYVHPENLRRDRWPMGIAIERGFHGLVEVLLRNGIPADENALLLAVESARAEIVELLFEFGADPNSIPFTEVVGSNSLPIFKSFLARGVDLVEGLPFFHGLTRRTRMWLGLYKTYRASHEELQFQADMALRYLAHQNSLRGVSLLMWLGANPRAKVPLDPDDEKESWETAMRTAAEYADFNVIKRLRPNPAKDDVQQLLRCSAWSMDIESMRYWIALGGDMNAVDPDGGSIHGYALWVACYRQREKAWRFLTEWFASGARWTPTSRERGCFRQVLTYVAPSQAYDFIKLLRQKDVTSIEELTKLLESKRLKRHLESEAERLADLLPPLRKRATAGPIRLRQRAPESKIGPAQKQQNQPRLLPFASQQKECFVRPLSDE